MRALDAYDTAHAPVDGLVWAPDSKRLFFSSQRLFEYRLP
jgi:hypothetical protein